MRKTVLMAALLTAGTVSGFSIQGQAADALSKEDVKNIVAEYLRDNPNAIMESLENYRVEQERLEKLSAQEKLKEFLPTLVTADSPSVGNVNGDVTVIEFFDYNCGYCRRAVPDIRATLKEDSNVRFVFKEMPILSQNSNEIAKWSIAANKQGKYFELHAALMEYKGNRDAATIKKMAADLDLDPEQLEKDANSQEVAAELQQSIAASQAIGIRGTPAFIINGELYPGYLGPEGLRQAIAKARQGNQG